jgi:holo-[acyl-carrier protein] synthase
VIIGIGTDIVDVRRIEALIAQYNARFLNRVFTKKEQDYCNSATHAQRRMLRYANRFAAKEACVKAIGVTQNISWLDMEVVNHATGKPALTLSAAAHDALMGREYYTHLSLSDEYPYAHAYVVIEAL